QGRAGLAVADARADPRFARSEAVGEHGWVAYAGVPLVGPDGEAFGVLGVVDGQPRDWTPDELARLRDVADTVELEVASRMERVQQEVSQRALSEAEERYRMLLEALPVVVYIAEPTPPYAAIYISPSMASLGYSVDEWFASPTLWVDSIHPDDRPRVLAETEVALAEDGRTDTEYRMVGGDGVVRHVHDRGQFRRDEAGRLLYWEGVLVDVTERKNAVLAARDQRRQLRQIIDLVPHLIFVKDATGRFLIVNDAMARAYGTTAEALEGRMERDVVRDDALAGLFHAEDLEVIRSGVAKMIPDREYTTPDGRAVVMDTIKVPFTMEGSEVPAVLGIAHDITADRERDRHLRRAERLAVMGTMVGGVAHELNNPLAAIKGFTELMLLDPRSDADREALEVMQREAERAARIVADLRRLSSDTQARGAFAVTGVNDVVRHVLRVRTYAAETRNVQLLERLDPHAGEVPVERGLLEQVVLNLVMNAEHAVSGRPDARITVTTARAGDQVTIQVADNGHGIEREHLERVFDPFWSTKAPGQGSGLGLSLVHSIVTDHGGTVQVTGGAGTGAVFTVRLPAPASPPAAPPAPPAEPEEPARPGLRVLVVDDEAAIRRTLTRALQRRGHRVDEAVDGAEAIRCLDGAADGDGYHVILSDLRMPGMSGADLLAELHRRGRGEEGSLVFLTGDAVSPDAAAFLATAGVPVLHKPFDLAEVVATVEGHATAA
ncbi:MAG TPA: ATP-binding protein, partial [Longimicrobiaceae bacterium]|nr:ATP-binding protein [Longimicrobiaceae bacterium]